MTSKYEIENYDDWIPPEDTTEPEPLWKIAQGLVLSGDDDAINRALVDDIAYGMTHPQRAGHGGEGSE